MILSLPKTTLFVALASLLLVTGARATRTYSSDDLFIGFHQDGNILKDYEINLGQASFFRDATVPFTLSIVGVSATAFAADMTAAFGSSWRTIGNISWGVVGTTQNTAVGIDGTRLLYVSEPSGNSAPIASGSQSSPATNVIAFKNYFIGSPTPTDVADGTVANSGIGNPTNSQSWTTFAPTAFNTGNLLPFEATLGTALDLYRLPQTNNQALVTNEGVFTINFATDAITFTPVVVPEPSTLVLVGGALVSLGLIRRRGDGTSQTMSS